MPNLLHAPASPCKQFTPTYVFHHTSLPNPHKPASHLHAHFIPTHLLIPTLQLTPANPQYHCTPILHFIPISPLHNRLKLANVTPHKPSYSYALLTPCTLASHKNTLVSSCIFSGPGNKATPLHTGLIFSHLLHICTPNSPPHSRLNDELQFTLAFHSCI